MLSFVLKGDKAYASILVHDMRKGVILGVVVGLKAIEYHVKLGNLSQPDIIGETVVAKLCVLLCRKEKCCSTKP